MMSHCGDVNGKVAHANNNNNEVTQGNKVQRQMFLVPMPDKNNN